MKLTPTQLRNFIGSWLISKPKPEPETVKTFTKKMSPHSNHEMWRTCNSCGENFDVKIEGKFICPTCGSVDLIIG